MVLQYNYFENQKDTIRKGIDFPIAAGNAFMLSERARQRLIIESHKEKVLDYIKNNKGAFLSDIMKEFDIDMVDAKRILKKLEEEHKIKIE